MALSVSSNGGEEGYFPIDAELYQLLVTGNLSDFDQLDGSIKLRRCARDRSTVLHIAASFGHVDIVNLILNQCPELMVMGNSIGDLPIHSAIKTGRLNTTVQPMIDRLKENNNQIEMDQVLGCINKEGNTPLHCSLELYDVEHCGQTVKDLVEWYPRAAYAMNKQGICPLYLAMKRELCPLVKRMLDLMHPFKEDAFKCLMEGESVLHAAVAATTTELLEYTLCYNVKLTHLMHEGWSALSYAASMGCLDKVEMLIHYNPSSAFISNENKTFPIHVAVLGGHYSIVDLLTGSRFLLNVKGQNIFHLAALSGDSRIVSQLILNLSDVEFLINQKDNEGNTPLLLATRDQHLEVVEILIQSKLVNVGLSNKQGLTACDLAKNKLFIADDAEKSTVQRLNTMFTRAAIGLKCSIFPIDKNLYQSLLSEDMDQVNNIISTRGIRLKDLGCPKNGNTILHIVASMGKHQLLEYLLHSDRGCGDLRELANNNGDLPIHLAAKTGNLKSVRALLEWPDPDVRTRICIKQNKEGDTSLHVAVQYNHREVAKYLFNYCSEAAYYLNNNQIYPFFLAMNIWYDEIDMLTPMIKGLQNQKNLQLIRNDSMGVKSIIHETIKRRKIDILESLIDNAKDLFIHTYDDEGRNPLSYAASIGYIKGVQLLLQNFPSLEFECDQNEDGYFPIHHASKGGHIKIIKMLNLSICLLNNKQQNILHVAAEAGMHGVVCYLLKRQDHFKELVNIGDADGNTTLHLAAKGCYTYTMLHLIREKHIDTNIINNELFSAGDVFTTNLHSAEDEQCIGLRKLILKSLFIADKKKILVRKRREKYDGNEVKEMEAKVQFKSTFNDNLLLVATLIVSVTYNSTFNPPGGYKGDSGVPSLISSTLFNSFMKFNILACTFSFVATITLIFTKFNPSPRLVHISQLNLCIGVTMLVVAYAMGCNSIPTHNSLENTLIVMLLLGIFVGILYHPICSFPNLVLRLLRK